MKHKTVHQVILEFDSKERAVEAFEEWKTQHDNGCPLAEGVKSICLDPDVPLKESIRKCCK
jgi:hypothetical protein